MTSASPITTSGTPEHHTQHVDGVDGYLQSPAPAYGSPAATATIMSITEYYLWPLGNSWDGLLAPQNDALSWQTSYISYMSRAYTGANAGGTGEGLRYRTERIRSNVNYFFLSGCDFEVAGTKNEINPWTLLHQLF